jgi:uncharacterized protein (TIGR02466 family)
MDDLVKRQAWWSTPIVVAEHRDARRLNEGLARIILQKEREITESGTATPVAGVESGLTAHWRRYNVLNWDFPECKALGELVMTASREFIRLVGDPDAPEYQILGISCWANVLRSGDALAIHHHDPGFISGHYIVRSGRDEAGADSKESGHTVYYRPGFIERSQGDNAFGGPWDEDWRSSVPPVEGRLTLFPSYVRHEVKAHRGQGERISIALDIYVRKQRDLRLYFGPPRWFVPAGIPGGSSLSGIASALTVPGNQR